MALKNTRIGTDQRFALSLSNAGAKVNMNDVEVLHLCMYSNDQRSNDGSISYAVNADDITVLDLLWPAKSQSYLGEHSVHGTIRYAGAVASFDVPAVNVVSRTSEADISTDTIVLEAPVGTEDLTATITIQGMGPQGPKGDKMTYADLTQEDKKDLYEGASEVMKPLLATKQDVLTDTDGGYGQRVAKLEKEGIASQEKLTELIEFPISLNMDGYLNSKGIFLADNNYKSSDFVDINLGYTLECTYYLANTTFVCIYDKDKRLIASFPGTDATKKTTITINPKDYPTLKYLRVCSLSDSEKVDYSTKISSVFGIIPNDSIKTQNLQDESVSERKTTFFTHDDTSNFIDRGELVPDTIIVNGIESSISGWYATGKVKLLPNTVYYYNNLYTGYYAFYKADDTLIEAYGSGVFLTKPFTTPAETAYGRFSMEASNSSLCWIALTNAVPADYKLIIPGTYMGAIQLPDESITTPKIAEKAVTPAKSSFFIHDPNTDFIKQDNWVADILINEQGQEKSQSGFWATGFIPLLPNTVYYKNALWYGYYAFYDADKNLIEGHGNDGSLKSPFTTPAGTVYGRFTCTNTDNKNNAWIGLINNPAPYAEIIDPQYVPALQKKYCDYEGNEFSMFNKCICIGDSLTEGTFNHNGDGTMHYIGFGKYSYPTFLSKLTGIEVTNLGNAGLTSAEWYDRHKEDNLSGYDVAIIQLGTNDAARYSGWTETSITGFTNIINKLKNENTNIKIFVSTISKRFGDPSAAGKAVISDGIRQLVLSLADPNVILLDMEEYAHTGDEQAYECGHYSAYGYWRLAQDYKNIIGYYINSHKNLFRTVQFIGTDYSYSD